VVKLNGKPVAYAEVEVEYHNRNGKAQAPTDYMITQSVKADKNGVFAYAVPRAGWWGFAALSPADYTLEKDGTGKTVELGAVLWVEFHDWIEN
jgi:cobalt/nickel transport protein